jgi:hypothetical protein
MKKTPVARAPAKPFLRFHHSTELRTRTNDVLAAIEKDADPTRHAEKLANLVVELTDTGLTAFFNEPLKAAKVGFLLEQTASFGLGGALTMISPVIRSVIGRMSKEQLLVVAVHLRRFMR